MRRQCEKCPWKVSTNPHDIPNGYDPAKHRALESTIAQPASFSGNRELRIMVCHDTDDLPCVGWLNQQLGPGNNLWLRIQCIQGTIDNNVETVGLQHKDLESTLP